MRRKRNYARLSAAIAVVGLSTAAKGATGVTDTWTGGGSDVSWQTANNWGGTAPVATDSLVFTGTTRLSNTNNFTANTEFDSLTFDANAGAFTLGGNAINLKGDLENDSANLQSIAFGTTTTLVGTTTVNSNLAAGSTTNSNITLLSNALKVTGQTLNLHGYNLTLDHIADQSTGVITSTNPATLTMTYASGTATSQSSAFQGTISGAITVVAANPTAQIQFGTAQTYTGATIVSGTMGLYLNAASATTGGSIKNSTQIILKDSAELYLNNENQTGTVAGELPASVHPTLENGGGLVFLGRTSVGSVIETFTSSNAPVIDGFGFLGGFTFLSNSTTINLPAITRNNRSVALLRSAQLGATSAPKFSVLVPTAAAPALVSGGSGSGAQTGIVPWLFTDTSYNTGVGQSFATEYNDAGSGSIGFEALAAGQFDTSLGAASTHDNVQRGLTANASDSLPGGVTSINSLALITSGSATNMTYSGSGAITIDSGGLLIAGILSTAAASPLAVTLNGFSKIDFGSQEGVFIVNLENLKTSTTAIFSPGTVQDNVEIDGSNGLTKGGKGTLSVNVAANYTGTTTVSGGALVANGNNVLPTSTVVYVNADSFLQVASGNSQQIAGLSGEGFVQNGGTGSPATVVINPVSPASNTFTGIIEDNGAGATALTIQGSGTQILTGASTYSGGTSVTGGSTLNVNNTTGSGTGSGSVSVTGSTLGGSGTISSSATFTSGTLIGSGLTVTGLTTFNSTGNTLSGSVNASGGVAVAAAGSLALSGTLMGSATVASGATLTGNGSVGGTTGVTSAAINGTSLTLTGVTTFNSTGNTLAGTVTSTNGVSLAASSALAVNGTLSGAVSTVAGSHATLSGTGSITGAVTLDTAALEPGTVGSTGKLTASNTLTLDSNSTFVEQINGAAGSPVAGTDYSQLSGGGSGAINLGLALLNVVVLDSTPITSGTYVIIDATGGGSVTGVFASSGMDNLGDPYTVTYGSDSVSLTFAPEPGSLSLLCVGALGLLRRRRRRQQVLPMG